MMKAKAQIMMSLQMDLQTMEEKVVVELLMQRTNLIMNDRKEKLVNNKYT